MTPKPIMCAPTNWLCGSCGKMWFGHSSEHECEDYHEYPDLIRYSLPGNWGMLVNSDGKAEWLVDHNAGMRFPVKDDMMAKELPKMARDIVTAATDAKE